MNEILMQPDHTSTNETTIKSEKGTPNYTIWFVLISVFCFLLLALNSFQLISSYKQSQIAAQRAATYQERVKEAENLVLTQRNLILSMVDDYEQAAYKNPSIERITEQQLIAAEYTLNALQILAIQNSQIIELLANTP